MAPVPQVNARPSAEFEQQKMVYREELAQRQQQLQLAKQQSEHLAYKQKEEQVAEQASIDAERVADADREMGVLRGKLQEMQEALEQQQENGMHHRQQLKDALARQEQETATHRQAVSDTQVKLQETQARLDRALERSADADREMSSLRSKLQEAQDQPLIHIGRGRRRGQRCAARGDDGSGGREQAPLL